MRITEVQTKSDTQRVVFDFYIGEKLEILLDVYQEQYRESKRHGWKCNVFYSRTTARNNNINRTGITVPDYIIEGVKHQILKKLTFKKD
jgi:hypothetical protein